ncbi:MAG TPA: tetratricopeptide repeat protein [Chloroflexota bacterium]|nr:tetratricopeptide repeat protein [Chloroflexota bacterium]
MSPIPAPNFGLLLSRYRRGAGLTQEDLAERAGLSRRTISDLERGVKSTPQAATLDLLLSALDLPDSDREALVGAVPRRRRQARGPDDSLTVSSLPAEVTPLVGREREEAAALHLLTGGGTRLLTLTGPGGVGKSRLALRVASLWRADSARDVVFVPLAAIPVPAAVPAAICRALGIKQGAIPTTELLMTHLRERELLLVLDNVEHLSGAELLVSDLMGACAGVSLLVTSRTALNLRGEQLFDVPPLETPPPDTHLSAEAAMGYAAVSLFVQRAQAVWSSFVLSDSETARVANACRRLDGLPLAIELAAGQLRHQSLEALATRLPSGRAGFPGPADSPARQRTMRDTVAWSYALLAPPEQAVFRALSVFIGGFTVAAAKAVVETAAIDVDTVITALARSNLIVPVRREDGHTRFSMLETIRDFSQEMASAQEATDDLRTRHALYFTYLADDARDRIRQHGPSAVAPSLGDDQENILAAIAWLRRSGMLEQALETAGSMVELWALWGYVREGRALIDGLLTEAEHRPGTVVPPDAWTCAARFAWIQNDYTRAGDLYQRSAEAWRKKGDVRGEAVALNNLGTVAHIQTDYELAAERYERAAELGERSGNVLAAAMPLGNIATIAMQRGDFVRAEDLLDRAITLYRSIADQQRLAIMLGNRGSLAFRQERYEKARAIHEEALAIHRSLGDRLFTAQTLGGLALTEIYLGRLDEAEDAIDEALEFFAQSGQRHNLAEAFEASALIAQRRQSLASAAHLYAGAERLRSEVNASHHPADIARHRSQVDALRAAMGKSEFDAAWRAGSGMTAEALLEIAYGPRRSSPTAVAQRV